MNAAHYKFLNPNFIWHFKKKIFFLFFFSPHGSCRKSQWGDESGGTQPNDWGQDTYIKRLSNHQSCLTAI